MINLTFKTLSQQWVFCATVTKTYGSITQNAGQMVSAWELFPDTPYDVFIIVENSGDEVATNVRLKITHGPIGIGFTDKIELITPNPTTPVTVPPAAFGVNGQQTISFRFDVPVGGVHTCLGARFEPDNGQCIGQNTTVVGLTSGVAGTTHFAVYGLATPNVLLTLEEKDDAGNVIPPGSANSWNPLLNAQAGSGIGVEVPTPSPIQLTGLSTLESYSIILTVTPSGTSDHIFTITGTDPASNNVGSVDIKIQALAGSAGPFIPPAPYVTGQWHSPDIILTYAGTDILTGSIDDQLTPDTEYEFSVIVHNASPTPAENTSVKFWQHGGGLALDGKFLDEQTVTIPAWDHVRVKSDVNFKSAPLFQHTCAVVSIYNSMSACQVNATVATQIPTPSPQGDPGCSAYRNTNSAFMWHVPFEIHLALGVYHKTFGPGPVEIEVQSKHVPVEWHKNEKVLEMQNVLKTLGQNHIPLYLSPAFKNALKSIDLKTEFKLHSHCQLESKMSGKHFHIIPKEGANASFIVSGVVPKDTKNGDTILVNVIAHYPKSKHSPARSVEFLQIIHVTDKGK